MAQNGTIKTAYQGWTYRMYWSATQSVSDNTSTVLIDHWLDCASSYDLYIGARVASGTVGSDVKYIDTPAISTGGGSSIKLGTTQHTVTHEDDGTKTVTIKGIFDIKATLSGTYKQSLEASGTVTLDTIARASQPSLKTYPESTENVGDFGSTIEIHMNQKADNFTHTVRYEYGDLKGTIATGVKYYTTWKIPLSFMDLIPNATSGSGRVYVDTYNGSTLIGTKYTGFTATVPASVKPTVSIRGQLEDTTGNDDIYGSPVAGLSKIKVTPAVTLAYSSPIKTYAITIDGKTYASKTVTTGVLQNAGSSIVTVTVTDSRGRSGSDSYTMNVQEYTRPQVTALSVHRVDEDGNEFDQGENVSVTFSTAVSSMGGKNSADYVLRYKKTTSETWTTLNLTDLADNFNVMNHVIIFAAAADTSYDVELSATDRHSTTARSTSASTAFSLMDWHDSGTGLRFGGVAELPNTLQNDLSLKQTGNSYAFQPEAFGGAKGYISLAEIALTELNVNAPIVFEINRRGALCPMRVYVRFASSSTTTDPDLGSIVYEGDNYGAFLVKQATSIWRLYVDNTSGWSNPCLQTWYTTENQKNRLSVTFPSEMVEGTDPSVLGSYYRATPVKMQSLVDFIYPVGSVYISYSHVSPASLFGGTWQRITNAFLWATDASGEIGATGGSKTHTLQPGQIPRVPVWSDRWGSSVLMGHWTEQNNAPTDPGFSPVNGVQGGTNYQRNNTLSAGYNNPAAVNHMPPYIQVSVWRRTA